MTMDENRKPIILCCGANGRAAVFGYVDSEPVPGSPVTLHDARMVLYWPRECEGLFGLAANGPKEGLRITPAVGQTTETVWQEWIAVGAEAAEGLSAC